MHNQYCSSSVPLLLPSVIFCSSSVPLLSCLCFDASAIPWCTEAWRKNKGFTKEVMFSLLNHSF